MARVDMKRVNKEAEGQIGRGEKDQASYFLLKTDLPPVLALATALGETRSGLARRTGISLSTLAKWDAGSVSPRKRQIGKLLAGCPITEDEFIARFDSFHPGLIGRGRIRKSQSSVTKEVMNTTPLKEITITEVTEPVKVTETEDWDSL